MILHSTPILHPWAKRRITRITPCIHQPKYCLCAMWLNYLQEYSNENLLTFVCYLQKQQTLSISLLRQDAFQATQSQPNYSPRRWDQSFKETSWYATVAIKVSLWVLSTSTPIEAGATSQPVHCCSSFLACSQCWMRVTSGLPQSRICCLRRWVRCIGRIYNRMFMRLIKKCPSRANNLIKGCQRPSNKKPDPQIGK